MIKRFFDISFASAALVLVMPMVGIIAVVVLAGMGRPICFRQEREGLNGKSFVLYKFRTMTEETDDNGKLLSDDLRLTRVGSFLRRTRLDELPELIDVICGRLSVVGPRPLLVGSNKALGRAGLERLTVRPGLTGWAQVSGNTLLSPDEKVALDVWYIHNRSMLLDMQIILETSLVVLRGEKRNEQRIQEAYDYAQYTHRHS